MHGEVDDGDLDDSISDRRPLVTETYSSTPASPASQIYKPRNRSPHTIRSTMATTRPSNNKYPLATIHSPINIQVAQTVIFIFLVGLIGYAIWDIYHPTTRTRELTSSPITPPSTAAAVVHPSDLPSPRTESWWHDRVDAIDRQLAQHASQSRVAFLGDSITQGWATVGYESWHRHFTPFHPVNMGVNGDMTQEVLWRLDTNGGNEMRHFGRKLESIIICIGTNNAKLHRPEETVEGIRSIVRRLRTLIANEVDIFLIHILPRGDSMTLAQHNHEVNLRLEQLSKTPDGFDKNVHLVDMSHIFTRDHQTIDLTQQTTQASSPSSSSSSTATMIEIDETRFMRDRLHLASEGYEEWSKEIIKVLKQRKEGNKQQTTP